MDRDGESNEDVLLDKKGVPGVLVTLGEAGSATGRRMGGTTGTAGNTCGTGADTDSCALLAVAEGTLASAGCVFARAGSEGVGSERLSGAGVEVEAGIAALASAVSCVVASPGCGCVAPCCWVGMLCTADVLPASTPAALVPAAGAAVTGRDEGAPLLTTELAGTAGVRTAVEAGCSTCSAFAGSAAAAGGGTFVACSFSTPFVPEACLSTPVPPLMVLAGLTSAGACAWLGGAALGAEAAG